MLSKIRVTALTTLFVQNVSAFAGFSSQSTDAAAVASCTDCILSGNLACISSGSEGTITANTGNADWYCLASDGTCSDPSETGLISFYSYNTGVYMSAIMHCPIVPNCGAETVKVLDSITATDTFTLSGDLAAKESCNWIFKSTAGPPAV